MGLVDRAPRILRDWGVSSLARMGRIIVSCYSSALDMLYASTNLIVYSLPSELVALLMLMYAKDS